MQFVFNQTQCMIIASTLLDEAITDFFPDRLAGDVSKHTEPVTCPETTPLRWWFTIPKELSSKCPDVQVVGILLSPSFKLNHIPNPPKCPDNSSIEFN